MSWRARRLQIKIEALNFGCNGKKVVEVLAQKLREAGGEEGENASLWVEGNIPNDHESSHIFTITVDEDVLEAAQKAVKNRANDRRPKSR